MDDAGWHACLYCRKEDYDQMIADRRTYLRDLSLELRKSWPDYSPHYIVCHGHSVPTGAFALSQVRPFDAYPHLLHRMLNEKYPTALLSMIVTAIGGEHATAGSARFERDVIARKPDLVTIDYGLNDRGDPLPEVFKAWAGMLDCCREACIPVILLTPTIDCDAAYSAQAYQLLRAHAEQIRDLAGLYQVGLADPFAQFEKHMAQGGSLEELLSWPNHPNRAGHEIIARQLVAWFPMDPEAK